MNVFRIIRLSLWAMILAACATVAIGYLAFSQAFLSKEGLTKIVEQSHLAETARTDILLPRLLATTRSSDYSTLLDDKTVTDAFNEALPKEALNAKLEPAVNALHLWLNSKEPSVAFSIDMTDLSNNFANKLSEKINAKVAALPTCTARNTLADAENAVCRSPFITKETLMNQIDEAIKNDPELKSNSTITPETIALPRSAQTGGGDLPSYLNMFYATSLIAAALAGLIVLWLLFKHRFAGIITIGAASLLAAAALAAGPLAAAPLTARLSGDELASKIAFAATHSLASNIQYYAVVLAGAGITAIIIGSLGAFFLARRRKAQAGMHLSSEETSEQIK